MIDKIFSVSGLFIGSQLPVFMQQYQQRLSGHVNELNQITTQLQFLAAHSGKTLDQYVNKFLGSADPDFHSQGEFMQALVVRANELAQALQSLVQAPIWGRFYFFVKDLNHSIYQETWGSFSPGLNLTLEGFAYAGAGMLTGWALYRLMRRFFKASMRRFEKPAH